MKIIPQIRNRTGLTTWLIFSVLLVWFLGILSSAFACKTSTTTPIKTFSVYQLEYLVLSRYPDFFWCDPDYYPVGNAEQEKRNAAEQFPAIRANEPEFGAILEHLGIATKSNYSDEEILQIYREHKKLTHAIEISTSGAGRYEFFIRVGSGQGYLIKGIITASGSIQESSRETSINTCPICLSRGTLISSPDGEIPVENISPGDIIWSVDVQGNSIAVRIERVSSTQVPGGFQVLEIVLRDGRQITASPYHPSATGKPLIAFQPGDMLDGSYVYTVSRHAYIYPQTYDILPAGPTGLYRANGIMLMSTLKIN